MGIDMIRKRDGREVPFDQDKIEQAIFASFQASGSARGHETSRKLTEEVVRLLENNENISAIPSVEQVQDTVEQVLMRNGFTRTAKSYILYRAERSRVREMNSRLMRTFGDIVFKDASESDIKRENANINGDTAMGAMLKFGSEGAKQYYEKYVMDPRFGQAHMDGDIHIHDMDFYTLLVVRIFQQVLIGTSGHHLSSTFLNDGPGWDCGFLRCLPPVFWNHKRNKLIVANP